MAKTKILVVEDNSIVAERLREILRRMNYDVPAIAVSSDSAIKEAEKHRPDLVLMDIKLKGDMDGIETAEEIRRRFNIPIIFTTAYVNDKLLKRAKVTGPYGYVMKPLDDKILKINIEISLYRAKMENEMKRTNEFLQNILNSSSHVSIVVTDREHNILYWNIGAENILGYKAEEMVNRKKIDVLYLDEDSENKIKEIRYSVINDKKSVNCDIREKAKDGHIVWFNLTLTPRIDEKDCVVGILGIGQDITERKKAEVEKENLRLQLVKSNRLVVVGELASGLAHEIGNPLQMILGNTELLLMDTKNEKSEELKSIKNAVLHAKTIIGNLLDFSRQKEMVFVKEDIYSLIDKTMLLYGKQLELKKIKVEKKFADLPKIMISPSHLEQVFLNIITNAQKAMPKGGTLTITTRCHAEPCAEFVSASLFDSASQKRDPDFHQGDNFVVVSFKDTGIGIPKENLSRLFEPFFTTDDHGTGLGLSVSYGIVKQHGGDILVNSDGEGKGTEFVIKLPVKFFKREK